jgi:hypothetical protein
MRCFEAMGCGALLVSDAGNYPEAKTEGVTLQTYASPQQAIEVVSRCPDDWPRHEMMASHGRKAVAEV